MSESALSLGYADIAAMVGRVALQYPTSSSDWSTQQESDIHYAMDKGYRDFLLYPSNHGMEWSFLTKATHVETTEPYSTGTVSMTTDDATVTLSDGTFPSWADQGVLAYDNTEYTVSSRTDDTHIELDEDWDDSNVTAGTYELRRLAYDLPDDWGQPKGWFKWSSNRSRLKIERVGPETLLAHRSGRHDTSYPYEAAVRPQTSDFDGTAGQRWEVMFFPLADAEYMLYYSYYILVPYQLRTATPYPVGGMGAAEAVQDCCIAAGRYLFRDMPPDEYRSALDAACRPLMLTDAQRGPNIIGYNRDESDGVGTRKWTRDDDNRYVTVNDVVPDT